MSIFSNLRLNLRTKLINTSNILKVYKKCINNFSSYKRSEELHFDDCGTLKFREFLYNIKRNRGPPKFSDWHELRKEIIKLDRHVNEINVDSRILNLCIVESNLQIGKQYVKFLNDSKIHLNTASYGRLLKLYYIAGASGTLENSDRDEIIGIYKSLTTSNPILDATTCELLINALCYTDEWREGVKLLDMIKITCKPSCGVYSNIICCSFKNKEIDFGWTYLKEMVNLNKVPKCEVFINYFKYYFENNDIFVIANIEKMLHFIGDNEIIITEEAVRYLQKNLQKFNINSNVSNISKSGQCTNCKKYLKSISITNKEFKILSNTFLDKVLLGSNIFLKSNPKELDSFMKFVEKTAPYDCVIDGLNVAFSSGRKTIAFSAMMVATIVKYFVDQDKRTLVLGRKHMNSWKDTSMNYIRRNSDLFLTENISQDDPYLLYAALKSGPRTDFFSRDLMRSHAHQLGPELKIVFRKWQQEHQYSIINSNNINNIQIQAPVKFNRYAHKIFNNWHVPYRLEYITNPPQDFGLSQHWFCLSIPDLSN